MAKQLCRPLRLESLEQRNLLASYTYPYGAQSFDTGEYMLGDIAVNVVLMESDPTLAPYDNNPENHPTNPGRGAPAENWTTEAIAAVKANVTAGLQWWKDTLYNVFPNAPANLLNFHINWEHADTPVPTGYEPIARTSDEFLVFNGTTAGGWIYDFLSYVGFDESGNFSADLRSYNDYSRQTAQTDWAFTIFVVNNAADSDKLFAPGGSFSQAFAFAGGRFMVVPASRPASTYAHEAGHQFWAIDQYFGGGTYASRRGYYNTQNYNAADNPAPGFVQANSIMARDETNRPLFSNAYNGHTSDPYTLAQIGWQDTDQDGIFDVLDVPFSLNGSGQFNTTTGVYTFTGSTVVGTLNNANTSGSGNDITINQVNVVEASINNGPWQTVQSFPQRTYQTNLNIGLPIGTSPGIYEIRLRSADLRTGVTSNIFFDDIEIPSDPGISVSGIVFNDINSNGRRNPGEPAFPDIGIEVLNQNNEELDFVREVEPSDYPVGMLLNNVGSSEGVSISASGAGATTSDVFARSSNVGLVFGTSSSSGATQLWNDTRKLRIDFAVPVGTVSLKAFAGATTGSSFARLEAYSANGTLLTRFNSGALHASASTVMTVSRGAGDIAYVVAYGRFGSNAILDTLTWGASTSATSNSFGAYSLNGLPDGTYHVHVSAPAGYVVTTPPQGFATVIVSGGVSQGLVDFGIGPERNHPFHNVELAYNVNNDAQLAVTGADVLMVINFINAGFAAEGEISSNFAPASVGYVDVNNDGRCTAADALVVINLINAGLGGGGGEGEQLGLPGGEGAAGGSGPGGAFGEQGPEGETTVNVPTGAAEYFAQTPQRVLVLRGDDEPCGCQACSGARVDGALEALNSGAETRADLDAVTSGIVFSADTAQRRDPARLSETARLVGNEETLLRRRGREGMALAKRSQVSESLKRPTEDAESTQAIDDLLSSADPESLG